MPTTKPVSVRHAHAAINEVINRHVAGGLVSHLDALVVECAALPIVAQAVKALRQGGRTPAEVTAYFAGKVEAADDPGRRFAAEVFAAAWRGMQADYREMYGCDI